MKLGFQFVPFPRDIWEKPIHLTGQEFQLLGWFLCDLRLGLTASSYTDKQVLNGCNNKPGVNLSRNAFKSAREGLTEKGFVDADYSLGVWTYRLKVSITDTEIEKSVSITDTAIKEEDIDIEKEKAEAQAPFVLSGELQSKSPLPEWIPRVEWNAFLEMRKKQRKPMTDRAVHRMITRLSDLREAGHSVGEILDNSTVNCWTDVYEPKNGNGNGNSNGRPETKFDRISKMLEATDGELASGRGPRQYRSR